MVLSIWPKLHSVTLHCAPMQLHAHHAGGPTGDGSVSGEGCESCAGRLLAAGRVAAHTPVTSSEGKAMRINHW